ncbi:MAG: hypothetical protein LBF95_05155 [Treponema sp.]|jgi:hypothetical protein|nr:hypothetical protein [Treponema sp.]
MINEAKEVKVKDLTEYTENTSEHEVFSFLYDRIVSREIRTFSALVAFAEPVARSQRLHPVLMRAFELIKKLNWGFFANITPASHKKLWKELVISDKTFPDAGDLKRTLQISNLYISMLDIHGYTKFCQESRTNLSRLHTLDRIINHEIQQIAAQCQSVSRRERGDEIVVISAGATDALTVTLGIIDYFSKTTVVDDPAISNRRVGDEANNLPVFKISAGITGGNTTSPLIFTEQGELSGFLLNSGARLQTRANELSPRESRVMVSKQVQMNYLKENQAEKSFLYKNNRVYFFDTGQIEFKGVMLPTCEAVFNPQDRYKEKVSEPLQKLFASIRDNLWEQRIFTDLMDLLIKMAQVMPKFNVVPPRPVRGMQTLTNESMEHLCRGALKAYLMDEDYHSAVEILRELISLAECVPQYDRLIIDYLKGITDKYARLLADYETTIDRQVEEAAEQIFPGNNYRTWQAAKNGAAIYEKLKVLGRRSGAVTKKKNLWYSLIKQSRSEMEFTLHSGKK